MVIKTEKARKKAMQLEKWKTMVRRRNDCTKEDVQRKPCAT